MTLLAGHREGDMICKNTALAILKSFPLRIFWLCLACGEHGQLDSSNESSV